MHGYTCTTDLPESMARWPWDLYGAIEAWMLDHVTVAIGKAPTIEVTFRDDSGRHDVNSVAEAEARTHQGRTIPTSLELRIGGVPPTTSDRPCAALRLDAPTSARVFLGHPDAHQARAWKTEFDAWLACHGPSMALTARPTVPTLGAATTTESGAHVRSSADGWSWHNLSVTMIIGGTIIVVLVVFWVVLVGLT